MSWTNFTMGVCYIFLNSSATVKLTNVYMQSVTFAHRGFKVTIPIAADVKSLSALGATDL